MQVNQSWLQNGWLPPDPDQTYCNNVILPKKIYNAAKKIF